MDAKENEALAQRAVACNHWRWMPGMLTLEEIVPPAITLGWDAARIIHADERDAVQVCTVLGKVRDIHATALPDLTDPATLGCLLALVRKAHESRGIGVTEGRCSDGTKAWLLEMASVTACPEASWTVFDTEAEALVAALESA